MDARVKARVYALKAARRVVSWDDLDALAKELGYRWNFSGGPALGNPEVVIGYVRRDGKPGRLRITTTAVCGRCERPHDRWANAYAAKEYDEELISVCGEGHETAHAKLRHRIEAVEEVADPS